MQAAGVMAWSSMGYSYGATAKTRQCGSGAPSPLCLDLSTSRERHQASAAIVPIGYRGMRKRGPGGRRAGLPVIVLRALFMPERANASGQAGCAHSQVVGRSGEGYVGRGWRQIAGDLRRDLRCMCIMVPRASSGFFSGSAPAGSKRSMTES